MTPRAAALPVCLLLLACGGAGGEAADPAGQPDQDVRGIYALTGSDPLTIRLDIGGAVQEATAGTDEIITFNAEDGSPLELDLAAYCADPTIHCPQEAWPSRVAIDEDSPALVSDLHGLRTWDADLPATVVSGAVDHRTDQFLFGLDSASGGSADCAALAISLAGGTFYYPDSAADAAGDTAGDSATDTGALAEGVAATTGGPTGIVDGRVAVGWLGVCAWSGLAVAATLSVEMEYQAVRVGDLE